MPRGLAAGQKNTTELGSTGRDKIGFNFAVAEECAENDECQDYRDVYGDHVIVIEYGSANFKKACAGYGAALSIVRRDEDVTAPAPRRTCTRAVDAGAADVRRVRRLRRRPRTGPAPLRSRTVW
jgi:hypothetical protein